MKVLYNNIIFGDQQDAHFYDNYEEMLKAPAQHMSISFEFRKVFSMFLLNNKETCPFCSISFLGPRMSFDKLPSRTGHFLISSDSFEICYFELAADGSSDIKIMPILGGDLSRVYKVDKGWKLGRIVKHAVHQYLQSEREQ